MQIDETMTELPLDRLDADRFYRTLQAFSIAASNGASDPWAQIPWRIADRHKEIVMKLLSNDPDHRKEVEAYLLECLRLSDQSQRKGNVIPFPADIGCPLASVREAER